MFSSKIYFGIIALGTALAGAGLWFTLTHLEPFAAEAQVALLAFYSSTGVTLTGLFTLVNYLLRLGDGVTLFALLRQGLILSLLVLGFLFLQHLQILTWWDGSLLIAIALLIEMLFSAQDERVR